MEALQDLLGGLLRERERLHHLRLADDLERNRREIVRVQWELAQALIARHAVA